MPPKPTYEELERRVRALEKAESDRLKAEKALRETEMRFRAIYEQAPIGIAVIDSRTGRFLTINEVFCHIVGYTQAEMLAIDFMQITHPDDLQEDLANMTRLRAGDIDRFQMKKRYYCKDGSVVWVSLTVAPLWKKRGDPLHHIAIVQDITAQQRSSYELSESRQKYRTLFETANDAIFIFSADTGVIRDANRKAENLTGRSRAEMIGLPQKKLHPVEQAESIQAALRYEVKYQKGTTYPHFDLLHKSGARIPVEISQSYLEVDKRPCVLGIFRDISEKKKTEKALIESENRYRSLFRNRHVAMLLIDPRTGAIKDANQAAAAFYGWSHKELTGMHIQEINTLDSEEVRRKMGDAHDLHSNRFHFQHRLKDGSVRDVEVASGPVAYGEKTLLYSIIHDITKRKQAEQALKQSEANLKKSQQIAKLGNFQTNLKENYWTASDEFYRIFGLPKKPKYSQEAFQELVHPDDFDDVMAYFNACLREHKPFNYQYRCVKHDTGEVIHVQCLSEVKYDPEGAPETIFGTKQDITRRKHAETALQDALAEKEVLLREIHHRVKNNMQVIVALLRMHRRRIDDARLTAIFNDCRDRIEAMSLIHEALYQSEDLAHVDFNAYCQKLCRNLGQAYNVGAKGITVTAGRSNVVMDMDQGVAVGMIIAELISNAFKHAFPQDQSGNVAVHVDQLEDETIQLVVADTGKGVPPDFDIHKTSSLGLRLVVGAAERELGGNVQVENDGGARFIIRFKCESV